MINISRLLANASKWQKNLNALSGLAASQSSSIHLIVPCLQVSSIFGQKAEPNLRPGSVPPKCPDQEGYIGKTISFDGFDGEEEVFSCSAFKVMNSWVRRKLPMATLGTVVKE